MSPDKSIMIQVTQQGAHQSKSNVQIHASLHNAKVCIQNIVLSLHA